MSEESSGTRAAISLPKGGGAVKGIGETFQPNLFTGTGNFSVPIFTSPGRAGFGPQLTLQYSTGNGNGPFGLGWQLSIPRITRKTEKGLPKYTDEDVFVMSGVEDMVVCDQQPAPQDIPEGYHVTQYRPRTEGLFARIEKLETIATRDVHWRVTTKENVTSIYGKSKQARIIKPQDPEGAYLPDACQTYEWLLQETFDAKGNHVLYEYIQENPVPEINAIYEQNREYTQTYLRRILYGNTPDNLEDGKKVGLKREGTNHANPMENRERHYLFEVFFDYFDQPESLQIPYTPPEAETAIPISWPACTVRKDPFSTFRAGFEIRTLRLCKRVLMLHHFKEGELSGAPLVKSTDFTYENAPHTRLSMLKSATITGYRKKAGDNSYISSSMPPVKFGYTQFQPQNQHYQSLSARNNDLPPFSLKNPETTLVDLFGDGLPDILNTTSTGYSYWKNLGDGQLDMRHPQQVVPAGLPLSQTGVAFADLGGDGLPDLMVVDESISGFFEATPEGGWKPFKKFTYPCFGLNDPNVRLLDLTGDGRSDVLMTRDHHFLWYECLGEEGYGTPQTVDRVFDLEQFPDVYFNDPAGRVRLADMTGDGLNDIVLVHNGRIDYWPNLGYGRFGRRITMQNAPRMEYNFDPSRLFLADLDGNGCADLVYVAFGEVHFWLNQSGNGWSEEQIIHGTPYVSDTSSVQFADVFGTGTATLVWSYEFDSQPDGNYKALDFCGGVKPHLLVQMDNNLGATTRVQYAPSTKFYMEDKKNGLDWATNLPFPVQVVEKVEAIDHIGKTKLVTTYKYHHGYFDGREREFRGFGRVDQFDTETFDDFTGTSLHGDDQEFINNDRAFHAPPVETRTWFHTGIYYDEDQLVARGRFFDHHELMDRYRREFWNADADAFHVAHHEYDEAGGDADGAEPESPHEAFRALRGALLRSEVYARDDTEKAQLPYVVTENRYLVKQLQPRNSSHHGVYFTTTKESITHHYERNPQDPRIAQTLTLAVDGWGNITDSVAIAYPRRIPAYTEQEKLQIVYTKVNVINRHDKKSGYFIGVPCQTRRYEVGGVQWEQRLLIPEDFATIQIDSHTPLAPDHRLEFHNVDEVQIASTPCKRIIEWTRNYFRSDTAAENLDSVRLGLGAIESLGLPYESYSATLNQTLVDQYGDAHGVDDRMLGEAGYVKEADVAGCWWTPSGRQTFETDRFYQPNCSQDPFGNRSEITYDAYGLVVIGTTNALQNTISAEIDYRTLQPWRITDPNGNRSAVAFDVLGLVVGTAVMGKEGEALGDRLEDFEPDPLPEVLDAFLQAPRDEAAALLAGASTRIVYDLNRYERLRQKGRPVYAATLTRETHCSDESEEVQARIQVSFSYSDGFGREIQKKVQAEPGPVEEGGPTVNRRWVGSGWTIFNNKGKPVRQYEPFFTATHEFEFEPRSGVSPTLFYDPLERVVCTLHPNRTYEKVVFDVWKQETWDVNDTLYPEFGVTVSELTAGERQWFDPSTDADVGGLIGRLTADEYLPTWLRQRTDPEMALTRWPDDIPDPKHRERNRRSREAERTAARNALAHAATPATSHLDVLGRPFLTIADNGIGCDGEREYLQTRVQLDIQGNDRVITDPMGIRAFRHEVDMLKRNIVVHSADAGRKAVFLAVDENPICSLDANGNRVRIEYDALRRPTRTWVAHDGGDEILAEAILYGEEMGALFGAEDIARVGNHRGQAFAALDGAGLVLNLAYDFKGNLLAASRRLARDYGQPAEVSRPSDRKVLAPDWKAVDFRQPLMDIQAKLKELLEPETFISITRFDALNRTTNSLAPDHDQSVNMPPLADTSWLDQHSAWLRNNSGASPPPFDANGSVYDYAFNDAGLLETVHLDIRAERDERRPGHSSRCFVKNIDYNAKGQRQRIAYGNGVITDYAYCPETYRLFRLFSYKSDSGHPVQDLIYTYDPAGNISQVEDGVFPTVFNSNEKVCPTSRYRYDPTYRLIEAFGREHRAMTQHILTSTGKSKKIFINTQTPSINNGQALRNYIEKYRYDRSGNIEEIRHVAKDGSWTRTQTYATSPHLDEHPDVTVSNRLITSGTSGQTGRAIQHECDSNGNMTRMPNKPALSWDHANRLKRAQLDDSGKNWAWYTYDAAGMRVRKVVKKNGTSIVERIYVGEYELWQSKSNAPENKQTIHVMHGDTRVAVVEIKHDVEFKNICIRYHLTNHLRSSVMELNEIGNRISYEEHYSYGGTTYLAGSNWSEVEEKRYRYNGKERDDETGLCYYGARYYAEWVGRWISYDPAILVSNLNLYDFNHCNPIYMRDPDGCDPVNTSEPLARKFAQKVLKIHQESTAKAHRELAPRKAELKNQYMTKVGERAHVYTQERLKALEGVESVDVELNYRYVDQQGKYYAVGTDLDVRHKDFDLIVELKNSLNTSNPSQAASRDLQFQKQLEVSANEGYHHAIVEGRKGGGVTFHSNREIQKMVPATDIELKGKVPEKKNRCPQPQT